MIRNFNKTIKIALYVIVGLLAGLFFAVVIPTAFAGLS